MYKALIIGAGQIAGGYDNPNDKSILTHAHAYSNNSNVELLGFYDVNYEAAEKMAEKWGGENIYAALNPSNLSDPSPLTPLPQGARGTNNRLPSRPIPLP